MVRESISVVGVQRAAERRDHRGTQATCGVMDAFIISIVVMVSQEYTYARTYRILSFERVYLIVNNLYGFKKKSST